MKKSKIIVTLCCLVFSVGCTHSRFKSDVRPAVLGQTNYHPVRSQFREDFGTLHFWLTQWDNHRSKLIYNIKLEPGRSKIWPNLEEFRICQDGHPAYGYYDEETDTFIVFKGKNRPTRVDYTFVACPRYEGDIKMYLDSHSQQYTRYSFKEVTREFLTEIGSVFPPRVGLGNGVEALERVPEIWTAEVIQRVFAEDSFRRLTRVQQYAYENGIKPDHVPDRLLAKVNTSQYADQQGTMVAQAEP